MCAVVNMEDLQTVHHEMGHIEYYLQYQDKPTVYKDGANPGSLKFFTLHLFFSNKAQAKAVSIPP